MKRHDRESTEKKVSYENVPTPDEKKNNTKGWWKIKCRTKTFSKARQAGTICYCYSSHFLLRTSSGYFWWLVVGGGCFLLLSANRRFDCLRVRGCLCLLSSFDCCQEETQTHLQVVPWEQPFKFQAGLMVAEAWQFVYQCI